MSGLSDYAARKTIDHLTGKTSFTMPTAYLALFTAAPADDGTGGTEISGGSYARKQTAGSDWNAASGSAPSSTTNANGLSFPAATADWGNALAFALYDAATTGNLLWWDYLGNHAWKPFASVDTAGDTVTCPSHGYTTDDRVVFTTEFGGTIPTGITAGTVYFVLASGLTTDAFKVSTTSGGAAANITAAGMGMVRRVVIQSIPSGVTATFAAGALTLIAA